MLYLHGPETGKQQAAQAYDAVALRATDHPQTHFFPSMLPADD